MDQLYCDWTFFTSYIGLGNNKNIKEQMMIWYILVLDQKYNVDVVI